LHPLFASKSCLRVNFKNSLTFIFHQELLELLELIGQHDSTLTGRFVQVCRFYQNAMTNDTAKAKLAEFGLSQEKLQAGLQLVNEAEAANSKIYDAAGDAEQATADRNNNVKTLARERRRILTIAGVALKDKPELLEKLR